MYLSIIGSPACGKTTLFRAFTGWQAQARPAMGTSPSSTCLMSGSTASRQSFAQKRRHTAALRSSTWHPSMKAI